MKSKPGFKRNRITSRKLQNNAGNQDAEEVGSDTWQAQYQLELVPPGGFMIKRNWVQSYDKLPTNESGTIIQSVDTALKAGPQNGYSVVAFNECYW